MEMTMEDMKEDMEMTMEEEMEMTMEDMEEYVQN